MRTFKCQTCGNILDNEGIAIRHMRRKHGGVGSFTEWERDDDDESMASLMVQADIDRRSGLPIDSWLSNMLPPLEPGEAPPK